MYCNICGSPVDDKDIFCRKCGNKLIAAPEEVVFNPSVSKSQTPEIDWGFTAPKSSKEAAEEESSKETKHYTLDTSEFVWNVHEFSKEERPKENVTVDWKLGKVIDLDEEEKIQAQAKLDAQLQEEIAERKRKEAAEAQKAALEAQRLAKEAAERAEKEALERAEAERRAWEEAAAAVNELIEKPEADERPATLEDIEKDIEEENRNMKRDTAKIEKFYTFNKKNEEFQKLLDKEYERIRSKNTDEDSFVLEEEIKKQIEEAPLAEEPTIVFEKVTEEAATEENVLVGAEAVLEEKTENEPFDPVAHLKRAEEERNAILNYGKGAEDVLNNDEIIRRFDTMELEKDILELNMEKERKKAEAGQAVLKAAEETEGIAETSTVTETAAETANDAVPAEPVKAQNGWGTFSFLDELFGAPQNTASKDGSESEETPDVQDEISEAEEETAKEETPSEEPVAIEETAEEAEAPETVEEKETAATEEAEEAEAEEAEAEENVLVGAAAAGIAAGLDALEESRENDDFYSEDYSKKEKKKGGAGRAALIIIIVLLIIELAALGIKYLAPESSAAAFIDEKITQVVELFVSDEDLPTSSDVDNDGDAQQNPDGDAASDNVDIDSTPSSDKNAVIVNQASRNKNIASIKANDSLKYSPNTDYQDSGIKKSKELTDNILHKSADGTVYYVDQEVIGTLIAFDSGWIDYVNDKNENVFTLLKKDSNAYNNCKAFNKDVKKEFKLLEIGEIRAAEAGYYVWAHEVIETTSNGKTTSDEFDWVYYMEAVGGNMQIVDYCRF